ncbi:sugar-binding transcriptional regulator [Calidifontibacter terrae]
MDERSRTVLAATMYYLEGETMDAIAARLRTSRSSVSRLLKSARSDGIVQISVADPGRPSPLEATLRQRFSVNAHVVPVRGNSPALTQLDAVCAVAANLVAGAFGDDKVLGLAWGTTVSSVVSHLPHTPTTGSTVVQLNGGANLVSSGLSHTMHLLTRAADAFDAQVQHFPVPAFFDFAETRAAMWRERSVSRILTIQQQADIVVFGVGSPDSEIPSHLYAGGYLRAADQRQLTRERVVGDVCTLFLREDGSWRDIELNARASGPSPSDLVRIPRRVCVVAGAAKAAATVAALRAGVVTDLVIDEVAARAVLGRLRPAATADREVGASGR